MAAIQSKEALGTMNGQEQVQDIDDPAVLEMNELQRLQQAFRQRGMGDLSCEEMAAKFID